MGLIPAAGGGSSAASMRRIAALERVTADMHSGLPATGFIDVGTSGNGGVGIVADTSLAGLVANTDWETALQVPAGSNHFAVRLPAGTVARQAQVLLEGEGGEFPQLVSRLVYRGENGNWDYYVDTDLLGDVTNITLQRTASDLHVGTTTFDGVIAKDSRYDLVEKTVRGGNGIRITKNANVGIITVRTR